MNLKSLRWLPLFVFLAIHGGTIVFDSKPVSADSPESNAGRPNILYFYVDDMGWGSIGPNGQAERRAKGLPSVRTPNIDELARRGVNFRRGYGCHVCSPARSSQQSGFHQGHTFADRNDPDNAKKAMRAGDILMGDALSDAGYVTGYWGKWGYGGSKDQQEPSIDNVQTLPTSHGYQHVLAELHHVRAHTFFQPTLWHAPAPASAIGGLELVANSMAQYRNPAQYPNLPALQNDPSYPETAYCDDAYAFAALDFVRQQGMNYNETGQPFFGLLAAQIPHAPFGEIASLPNWDREYKDDAGFADLHDQTRQWAAMVTRIDAHFGNILAALEDPNHDGDTSDSIVNNTLVVFQSDNGGPSGKNNVELDANGGLRGNKGSIQEGGIRVPLVMCWPDSIHGESELKAGTSSNRIVDVTDLLPTFCELAGATVPLGIDGVSLAPTLRGSGQQRNREFIIHEAGNGQSIIRDRYKLVRSVGRRGADVNWELYDLEDDHSESRNIADDHPDLVERLEALLVGERVLEPRGFANTYHHWTGQDGADASDSDNWSDYEYENAGITYMTDDGEPRLSWTARMISTGGSANTAVAEKDLAFLGIEIAGDADSGAHQTLALKRRVALVGRNEVRVSEGGVLRLGGGSVSTLRWLDVLPGGQLRGIGTITGDLYCRGRIAVPASSGKSLVINGDMHLFDQSAVKVTHRKSAQPCISVRGDATIAGSLSVHVPDGQQIPTDANFPLIEATNIAGRFSNPNDEVIVSDGSRLTIVYGESKVSLVRR